MDLSWNFLLGKGITKLVNGLISNTSLKKLNLAWNGIGGTAGAEAITKCLRKNKEIEELDISNDRITVADLTMITKGLKNNGILKVLKVKTVLKR